MQFYYFVKRKVDGAPLSSFGSRRTEKALHMNLTIECLFNYNTVDRLINCIIDSLEVILLDKKMADTRDDSGCFIEAGPVVKHLPDKSQIMCLCSLYKVLSSHSRIQILWTLSDGELCVYNLAAHLHMMMSAVSHQLKILKDANLVTFRKAGKKIYYSLADDHIKTILLQGLGHINE